MATFDPEAFWSAIDEKERLNGWSALSRIERRLWRLRRFGDGEAPPTTDSAVRRALAWIGWQGAVTPTDWPRLQQTVHAHLVEIYGDNDS